MEKRPDMAKVMLVEDDATMLSLLKTLLEIDGYQVVKFNQEGDLLTSIHQEMPDIIILDVHLKQQNGVELLKTIRQDDLIRHLRVIMTSGSDASSDCRAAGADDFLMKPFMPDVLLAKIKAVIQAEN
jgi:DNA-binding response OmpR family regulator